MRLKTLPGVGLWVILISLLGAPKVFGERGYLLVPAGIHFDSTVSGGEYTVEELAQICREQGVKIAIVTDHDNMRVEYGIFPLRKITGFLLRKLTGQGERGSIFTFGVENYLRLFEEVKARYPELIFIPGVEAVPFYYWEGSLWKGDLKLVNFHKHLLVIGLKDAEDYRNLPSLYTGYPRVFSPKAFLNLIFVVTFLMGIGVFSKRKTKRIRWGGQIVGVHSHQNQVVGFLIILISALFLIDNYPFLPPMYDQYHGDQGGGPYQVLIDYVNQRGGMIFWAHPEVEQHMKVGGMEIYTPAYHEHLLTTHDYTGFAIFWQGMKYIGRPGGIWDEVLKQYCQGERERPVWAIGELDFEGKGNAEIVKEMATVLLLQEETEKGVLEAMRAGRMYATRNFAAQWLTLEEFTVSDPYRVAYMGETLKTRHTPHIRMRFKSSKQKVLNVQLIRNGGIIRTFRVSGSGAIDFYDRTVPRTGKIYYRILVLKEDWAILASNPIFVEFE